MVGDWMASHYGSTGTRLDFHLFLDNNGRYERAVRTPPDFERCDVGQWYYDDAEKVLRLDSDSTDAGMSDRWRVLSVTTCEDSNVLLTLREIILAGRNLPILFYRVHCNGRGYGTGWEETLRKQ